MLRFFPFFALLVAACSATEPAPAPSVSTPLAHCVPNQTLVCLCGLDEGTQTCTEEGTLTPCDCEGSKSPPDDASDAPKPDPTPKPEAGARCGDGRLDRGEACDDGNGWDGDGCSSACVPDGAPVAGAACPGQAVHLWRGASVKLAGTTEKYSHATNATCWNALGPERIYALTPHDSGVLTVSASFASDFDAVVSVRTDCAKPASEVLCEDTLSKPMQRVLQVEKGKTVHLFIDGDDGAAKGAFAVQLELL